MNRRTFLETTAAAAAAAAALTAAPRKRIAALSTTYHLRSHSDNFITRFLEGYLINDKYFPSPCDIVSLYVDQVHPADISRRLSMAYGFKIWPSIADALTLGS